MPCKLLKQKQYCSILFSILNIMLNKALESCKSYICVDDIKNDLKQQEIKELTSQLVVRSYNLSQKYLPKENLK